ncbi:unnamed protein product [Cylindrotheca closterium]|uniref:Uncharacterized protein n=1 Tax=Cylindrotheca closterium TaxID=2856 RepID=A0AAD2CH55_9STRA|nr:unnamed protein product [Cylindrotheca closterium]
MSTPSSKEEKMAVRDSWDSTNMSPSHFRDVLILNPEPSSTGSSTRSVRKVVPNVPPITEAMTPPPVSSAAASSSAAPSANNTAPTPPHDLIPSANKESTNTAVNMVRRKGSSHNSDNKNNNSNSDSGHFQRKRKSKKHRKRESKAAGAAVSSLEGTGSTSNNTNGTTCTNTGSNIFDKCCNSRRVVRSTLSFMKLLAKILLWSSTVACTAAVIWYSNELRNNGTDKHLIAWFSAGAFVLLGFPISIYGIASHLANYNKPEEQCYIVRILWMVPIYSIGSWLCLRYKDHSIYIETLRDFYESYVLYSFFQFLIENLGGEEQLILMLKDKSPTRGAHIWGMQWCLKPWLMGQPVRKVYETAAPSSSAAPTPVKSNSTTQSSLKRVHWTSPFFVQCKFGVLQYVLLKILCTAFVMILEHYDVYKEGNFTPKGGYLYICLLTNTSQCWALYCLIIFYYATKNELAPIRPVGKFLAVKSLVFFTWWQSLGIAILYQMDLIPHYHSGVIDDNNGMGTSNMPMTAEEALAFDEHGGNILDSSQQLGQEWTAEDVAKGLQDYLICVEMFAAAIVHIFVFPLSEYDPLVIEARARGLNQRPNEHWNKRLGRRWKDWDNKSGYSGATNTSSEYEVSQRIHKSDSIDEGDDDLRIHPMDEMATESLERRPLLALETVQSAGNLDDEDYISTSCEDEDYSDGSSTEDADEENPSRNSIQSSPRRKQGFVSALLDSTIPQDLRDNTVGIIKGDYVVEKKTLLHHAATSDSYDLFSRVPRMKIKKNSQD